MKIVIVTKNYLPFRKGDILTVSKEFGGYYQASYNKGDNELMIKKDHCKEYIPNFAERWLNDGKPIETFDLIVFLLAGLGFGGLLVLIINHL